MKTDTLTLKDGARARRTITASDLALLKAQDFEAHATLARDVMICRQRMEGRTLRAIGQQCGLGPERVRCVLLALSARLARRKQWLKSFCERTGRDARLYRVTH